MVARLRMSRVRKAVDDFRAFAEPRDGIGSSPFRLACWLDEPSSDLELLAAWEDVRIPEDLTELWRTSRAARLFEDIEYSQWGLRILSPEASVNRTLRERDARPFDLAPDDIVFAEFLGDQELLVRAHGQQEDGVLVALPLDDRSDWYHAGRDVAEFLERYLASAGEKYWESTP